MTKQSGLGDNLYVSGYDLSGEVSELSKISTPVATLDVTPINKEAMERIAGVLDGGIDYTTLFDQSADVHTLLSSLPSTDQHLMYCRGTTLGNPAACMIAKQIGYDPTRTTGGAYTLKTSAVANGYGLDWGRLLTAGKRTDTAATDGDSVDTAASASFGWQAYLQVFSFTGTSVTVTIEDSADDSSFATLSGASFTAVSSAPAVQRLASASATATVRRYVRVATAGTFSEAVLAVTLVKNSALRRT
ncbi:MAG: hypothetical protein PVJ28_00245 [Acidimicrobiia bacterium]|jgi:hypothetical protein